MDWLVVDEARCAHDTIDGETMVIDTATGHLVVLLGIGSAVWNRLRSPVERGGLLAEVGNVYGDSAAVEVGRFLQGLVDDDLVLVLGAQPAGDRSSVGGPPVAGSWPDEYVAPALERYDDISTIMAMDPVHEVDRGLGWPAPARSGDGAEPSLDR